MNIAKMTNLPPVEIGFRLDPKHPVIPLAMEVKNAGCAAPHAHPRGQLIYASKGVMRVNCATGIWFVPPSQAVWMPPLIEHQVYFPAAVSVRNLFIDPSAINGFPESCCVVDVPPLLRELILRAMTVDENYSAGSAEWRIMMVILDELRHLKPVPLGLPLPHDDRVRQVTDALLAMPGNPRTLAQWARQVFTTPRTLARLFVKETGMTFGDWRQQLRLLEAVNRLEQGEPVSSIYLDLGYQSLSAFIEMFRKSLGRTPGKYFQPKNP